MLNNEKEKDASGRQSATKSILKQRNVSPQNTAIVLSEINENGNGNENNGNNKRSGRWGGADENVQYSTPSRYQSASGGAAQKTLDEVSDFLLKYFSL